MNDHPNQPTQADTDIAKTLQTLRLLEFRPESSQRQISQALGLSLGKTHYLLHALLDKGLVKIQNFKRSDNKLAYAYLLTPHGAREKMHLTRTFLARKEAEFEVLRSTITELRREVSETQDPRGQGPDPS